jgi:hypothetical protein
VGKARFDADTDFMLNLISNVFCMKPVSDELQRKYLTQAHGEEIL